MRNYLGLLLSPFLLAGCRSLPETTEMKRKFPVPITYAIDTLPAHSVFDVEYFENGYAIHRDYGFRLVSAMAATSLGMGKIFWDGKGFHTESSYDPSSMSEEFDAVCKTTDRNGDGVLSSIELRKSLELMTDNFRAASEYEPIPLESKNGKQLRRKIR